jgi:hypothetical protein
MSFGVHHVSSIVATGGLPLLIYVVIMLVVRLSGLPSLWHLRTFIELVNWEGWMRLVDLAVNYRRKKLDYC